MSKNLVLEEVGPAEELPGFDIDDPVLRGPYLHRTLGPRTPKPTPLTPSFGSALSAERGWSALLWRDCALSEEHLLEHQLGRIRDVRVDASGVVYVLTEWI